MAKAQSKSSQEQAANFHVLPKRDAQKEQGRAPKSTDMATDAIVDRDVDAASLTGQGGNSDLNQSTSSRESQRDRSQVS